MAEEFYSVEQVAERLGLHVRTVRNYVREGRLKAVRIGKQYRIAREDLETLTGRAVGPSARETARRQRHVEASSIVQIDAIGPEAANRVSNTLIAAAGSRRDGDDPLRIESVYDEELGRLKVIVLGGLATTADIFKIIDTLMDQPA